jgi:hypothetical protein
MARERLADPGFVRVGVVAEERSHAHQNSRRAEAALESVRLTECCLKRVERVGCGGQSFDRHDLVTVRLHREEEARSHRVAVEEHRAGTADPMLATDVGAGQPELVPEEVAEQEPGLDAPLVRGSIHCDADAQGGAHELPPSGSRQPTRMEIARQAWLWRRRVSLSKLHAR